MRDIFPSDFSSRNLEPGLPFQTLNIPRRLGKIAPLPLPVLPSSRRRLWAITNLPPASLPPPTYRCGDTDIPPVKAREQDTRSHQNRNFPAFVDARRKEQRSTHSITAIDSTPSRYK